MKKKKNCLSARINVVIIDLQQQRGMVTIIWYEDMIDHLSYAQNIRNCELKAWKKKNSGLNGIRNHDLCDTGAVFY